MKFLKTWGLAALLMLFATATLAGWNIRQLDDGSVCWNNGANDGWCLDASGNVALTSGNKLDIDADADTSISASTDDVLDIEVGADVVLQLRNNTGNAHAYMIPGNELHTISRNVISVFDDFLQQTISEADGPWIFNDGADTEAVNPVIEANQEGGVITLVSGNVGDGCTNDCSQLVLSVPFQADSGALVFEVRLHIDAAITTATVHAGFTDITSEDEEPGSISTGTITTNATNGVFFVYDTDATTDEWFCIGVDGGTDATGNAATGVAPTADTYQVLRIEIDADGETARCYIDGVLKISLTAAATNASVNLYAIVGVLATTTTSRTVDVDYIYVGSAR